MLKLAERFPDDQESRGAVSDIPPINSLSPDDRPWRIDWFGDVAYPGSVRRYMQPSIRVSISPVSEPRDHYPPCQAVETLLAEQRDVWVPITCLGMIQVGDIWQDGRQKEVPYYFSEDFEGLEINGQTTVRIKAGLSVGDNYLLPFSAHLGHQKHTNSYCLEITAREHRIIVPCVELIRFYFGSSGILLRRLFTGPFREEHCWREKYFDPERRHLHLKLADGMPKYAVSDLARIATDEHAREAASSVFASCLNVSACGARYPHMPFPFVGRTSIRARGMWLPFGNKPKRTFLVFSMQQCAHPFGFSSLTYDPCERAFWRELDREAEDKGESTRAGAHATQKSAVEDIDPGARKKPRRIIFEDSIRFPDLRYKSVRVREIVGVGCKEVFRRWADGTVEKLAFGEGLGSSGEARAINVDYAKPAPTLALEQSRLPDFVIAGVAQAKAALQGGLDGVTAWPLVLYGENEPVFQLPLVVDEDGVVDDWLLHSDLDGHLRLRRACWVRLSRDGEQLRDVVVIEGGAFGNVVRLLESEGYDICRIIEILRG